MNFKICRLTSAVLVLICLLCFVPVGVLADTAQIPEGTEIAAADDSQNRVVYPREPIQGIEINESIYSEEDSKLSGKPAVKGNSNVSYYGRNALQALPKGANYVKAYDALVANSYRAFTECDNERVRTDIEEYGPFTLEETKMLMYVLRQDHPEFFFFDNIYYYIQNPSGVIALEQVALWTGESRKDAVAAVEAVVDEILSGLTDAMTDYEKALYLHDTLAARIYYDYSDNAHNLYGALVEGVAVCEGYTEAYQYLLQKAGIQSYAAYGTGNGGAHSWNYVLIDGEFYHVDLTWNDQGEKLYHAYFGLTDAKMLEDHQLDAVVYDLPVCDAVEGFYFHDKPEFMDTYTVDSLATIFLENDLKPHLYIPGDWDTFNNWLMDNIGLISYKAGIYGGFSFSRGWLQDEMVVQIITDYVAVVVSNDGEATWYSTVQEAANACTAGEHVRLVKDVKENLTLSQDLYIDLNGHEMFGTMSANGHKVFGMDTETDAYYSVDPGCFIYKDRAGNAIEPEKYMQSDNMKYYMCVATEKGFTFHRYYAGITKASLVPNVTGFGYKAEFCGDAVVRQQVESMGYDLWFTEDYVVHRNVKGFKNSLTLRLRDFIVETYGQIPVNATVSLTLNDGSVIESGIVSMSMRQMLEQVNGQYAMLTSAQKAAVKAMVQKYPIIKNWNTANLYV